MSAALGSEVMGKPLVVVPAATARGGGFWVRTFGSAVIGQAMLSAASLGVGLLLIRYSDDASYGTYVLVVNSILLLTSLQSAFFGPAMVIRMAPLDRDGRGAVVAGLYREQRRLLRPLCAAGLCITALLWAGEILSAQGAAVVAGGVLAGAMVLRREFFRIALLAHRRAVQVLSGDFFYVVLLVAGAALAVLSPSPVIAATITMALAALASSSWLSRELRRSEAWHPQGMPGLLRQIAAGASWATAGAATHWLFSQGYSYVVALTLDVTAVAAIAATRLLLMPVNLVSTGISSLMLSVTTGWLAESGPREVFRRLLRFSALLIGGACLYLLAMWEMREWIFAHVLKKQFEHRDALLMLWSLVVLLIVLRDQLLYLPLSCGRFRELTLVALAGAALSIVVTYAGMVAFGVAGALLGIVAGELVSVAGIIILSQREIRRAAPPRAA